MRFAVNVHTNKTRTSVKAQTPSFRRNIALIDATQGPFLTTMFFKSVYFYA